MGSSKGIYKGSFSGIFRILGGFKGLGFRGLGLRV